jgi:hypothetical protein
MILEYHMLIIVFVKCYIGKTEISDFIPNYSDIYAWNTDYQLGCLSRGGHNKGMMSLRNVDNDNTDAYKSIHISRS